jgi:hypothetical protein
VTFAYNARAGSEILLHYLRDYAIEKGEHALPGGSRTVARATYAVYNGGPQHLTRYRVRNTRRSLRAIDENVPGRSSWPCSAGARWTWRRASGYRPLRDKRFVSRRVVALTICILTRSPIR